MANTYLVKYSFLDQHYYCSSMKMFDRYYENSLKKQAPKEKPLFIKDISISPLKLKEFYSKIDKGIYIKK